MKKYSTGLIFGKFFPLHTGHVRMIEKSLEELDQLYVFVCSDTRRDQQLFEESKMLYLPTIKERLSWFTHLLDLYQNLYLIDFNEDNIPSYPDGWLEWSNRVKERLNIENIQADVIFSSEPQDVEPYGKYLDLPVELIDPDRAIINISATRLRSNPYINKEYLLESVYPLFFSTK